MSRAKVWLSMLVVALASSGFPSRAQEQFSLVPHSSQTKSYVYFAVRNMAQGELITLKDLRRETVPRSAERNAQVHHSVILLGRHCVKAMKEGDVFTLQCLFSPADLQANREALRGIENKPSNKQDQATLVSRADIKRGQKVSAKDIDIHWVDQNHYPAAAINNAWEVIGRPVETDIKKGDVLKDPNFFTPAEWAKYTNQ